jgi:hypothetical protein
VRKSAPRLIKPTRPLNSHLFHTYEKVEKAEKVGMPAQKRIALGAHSSSEFPLNSHLFHLKKAGKAEKAAHAMH